MIAFAPLLAVFTVTGGLSDSQVLQREAGGAAAPVITGTTDVPGRLQCRVGEGRWVEVKALAAMIETEARLRALREEAEAAFEA